MRIVTVSLLAIGLSVGSVWAQETASEENPEDTAAPAETTEEDASATATDSETEQPSSDSAAPEDAAVEQVVSVHGDWQIRCITANNSCYMYQLAVDERDIPIAEMEIVRIEGSADAIVAGVTIVTPLKSYLPEGVRVQIDSGNTQRYRYEWCEPRGCLSRFALRSDGLDQFKRGNKARLTVISVESPEPPVILDVSLAGFTAAYNELSTQ